MQVVSKNHFIMRPGLAGAGGGDGCELELERRLSEGSQRLA